MKSIFFLFATTVCLSKYNEALSFPGPRVYVVTPSTRKLQIDEAKSAPFYYHKWMKRMDTGPNTTTTSTTPASKNKSPDLIFAEFESDNSMQKSIRKLLEKEKIEKSTTTKMSPIYVPDSEENKVTRVVNYGLPVKNMKSEESTSEKTDYSFMFSDNYYNKVSAPVYLPSTTSKPSTTTPKFTTTTSTTPTNMNVENIWHIIDNEKLNQYSGNWEEVPVGSSNNHDIDKLKIEHHDEVQSEQQDEEQENTEDHEDDLNIDDNFALSGFVKNSGNGAENESRAIRTDSNIRFPYINLKPFQMKPQKMASANSKKTSNMYTSLDNFQDIKHPVRGEAQDVVNQQIDRYNPAQPYLPKPTYGSKVSKQSSPDSAPSKATASLVPPPPPPPRITDDDFPSPASYDSFPPYPPSSPDFGPAPPSPLPSPSVISQSVDISDNLDTSGPSDNSNGQDVNIKYRYKAPPSAVQQDNGPAIDMGYHYKPPSGEAQSDSGPVMDMGYQYKPPSPPAQPFFPTIPPPSKPFEGYSYNKPAMTQDNHPIAVADKPDFHGYHYNKPEAPKPSMDYLPPAPPSFNSPPTYGHSDPHPPLGPSSYGSADSHPSHVHDSDYPELIFQKGHDDMKGDTKDHSMGMMPPPLQSDFKPDAYGLPDDHGFPSDFPTDFKFHHDFDDHDHDYHYHPTTTTTEASPRVNRFSYYYLGKKLYYLPLYFSVYFIIYVGALIIKAVLRHKIVYPNSWRPNTTTATFFSKRSVDEFMSSDNLHEVTGKVTHAIATAAEKYLKNKTKTK